MLLLDLDGFVVHLFPTKSKAGNEFFEVKFKIAEATCVTIRIMKQANQTITENYLLRLNQEREPVTFMKLSKTPKGDGFFNTSKGSVIQKSASVDFNYNEKHFQKVDFIRAQNLGIFDVMGWIKFLPGKKTIQSPGKTNSLREVILVDHTSDIGKTIRGELTQSIEEGRKYEFHNLNLKNFFGKKTLQTAIVKKTTTAIVSDEIEEMPILSDDVIKKYIDNEEEINIKLDPKMFCPELIGTNLRLMQHAQMTNVVNL